ncbi:asparagine synthase [Algoriphagus kandeliae]|uniref:asparagine synthase (glutamine-hydrolyzing) n=1 Tax=Algoriphagus kandeliae TaxID=2562278 RepID=A0A4Y9QYE8_9BACT|nr:asparagine synthase-related protein [Algoriphagus kandeliae]TFV97389.1 asparagine synthase [Algoriphagus kandeliae]
MKGFFGILNLDNGPIQESSNRFLNHYPDLKSLPFYKSTDFFLSSLSKELPVYSLNNYPNLIYAGWCRLDNLEELRDQLGITYQAQESEVILQSYLRWGEDCLKKFLGDFSFVIWDQEKKHLFLAKDHLGVRPLFYLEHDGLFFFGTSITLIKKAVGQKLPLNYVFIANELKNYPPDIESTFFRDIKRLKPAHFLIFSKTNTYKEKRYWDLNPVDLGFCKKDEDYINHLKSILFEAIQSRIRNKKTIGSQLSGGLDSSAITVILSRLMDKKNLHTYSFVLDDVTREYSELKVDEQETQREIINYAGLLPENHHPITRFHFQDIFDELERRNEIMGGLTSSDSIWQDTLFKNASENNKIEVMFSGFPGDEGVSEPGSLFFADYIYKRDFFNLLKYILEFRRGGVSRIKNYFKAKKVGSFVPDYHKTQELRSLLNPKVDKELQLIDRSFKFFPDYKGWLKHRICMPDTSIRMESENLYANDYNMEMAYPLADIRILEALISLPSHLFKPKPMSRSIFREICKGILPDKVRLQKKSNGAFTLAFYEYLCEKNFQEFQAYEVKNHLGFIISEDELLKREPECSYCQKERLNYRKEIDYLIDLNWPPDEENS